MISKISYYLSSPLIKAFSIYTITDVIDKAIPFLLLPILTHYLSTSEYGLLSMFMVLVAFVRPFVGLNIHAVVHRRYYDKSNYNFPVYITNGLVLIFLSSFLMILLFYVFSGIIFKLTLISKIWLYRVVIVGFGQYLVTLILILYQAQQKSLKFGIYRILFTSLKFGLSLLFVVGMGLGWEGRAGALVIAAIISAATSYMVLFISGLIKWKINIQYIKNALNFGIPLIPHVFSGLLITMSDRVFITNMIGVSETGIYTVGYQLGIIVGIFAEAFNKAWVPWLFRKLMKVNQEIKETIVKLSYIYFILIILLALFLSWISPWILDVFINKSYSGAKIFIIWIAIGYSFKGMYLMVTNYFLYTEKTIYLSIITSIVAGIHIILNYYLIKYNGAIGAAQAITISFFIRFILTWYYSNKVYKMPWILRKKLLILK